MYYKYFLVFVTLFLNIFSINAFSCTGKKVYPNTTIKIASPVYDHSKSASQFPGKMWKNALGLTVAKTSIKTELEVESMSTQMQTCLYPKNVSVEIEIKPMTVYIDKKYKKNSCQYKVIKDHENYHVRVHTEGWEAFTPKIKEAVQKAVDKIKPITIHPTSNINLYIDDMGKQIKNDLQPLLDYIQKIIERENQEIDTDESYRKESKKCPSW